MRHLTELHGGTVTAESPGENRGSTFTVSLPLAHAPEPPVAEVMPVAEPVPFLRGVSVLVVDDDRQTVEFVRCALERYGAVVTTATSAREARARFERDPPDVLVADLLMPEENGLELIRTIRRAEAARGRHTPAAALSALARSEDRRRAIEAGFELHLTKPVDPIELASTVEWLAQQSGNAP